MTIEGDKAANFRLSFIVRHSVFELHTVFDFLIPVPRK